MKIRNKKIKFAGAVIISIFVLISCNKESPTVLLPDVIGAAGSIIFGYNYPEVLATYPQDTANNVPVNSTLVIVFNEPIDDTTLAGNIAITSSNHIPTGLSIISGEYSISSNASDTAVTITFNYGGAYPLMENDTVTVTLGAGITDPSGIPLNGAPVTVQFDTGDAPDTTQPNVILAPDSRIPANGSTTGTLTPAITVDFTKVVATPWDLDVSTLNSDNFYLREQISGLRFPTDNPSTDLTLYTSPTASTRRAALRINAPNILTPGTIYEVVVNAGATGVKDLTGNELTGSTTWSFTTIATPNDPYGGLPAITLANPVTVNSVDNSNAYVTWGTTKPTTYTLRYGRGDSLANSVQDLVDFLSFRSVTVTPGAPSAGRRYWISLSAADYHDILGNAGTNSSGTFQFNTTTNDVFTTVGGGAGNQSTVFTLSQASLGGVFAFWINDSSGLLYLYGQKYTNVLGTPWGSAGTGIPLYTPGVSYSYSHAAEDGAGGVVLMAADGTNVYAKRVLSGGTFDDWGDGGGTAANTPGLQINGAAGASNGRNAAVENPSSGLLDRVLYAWQQAGAPTTVKATVRDLTGTPPAIDVAEFTLDNGQTPFVIPDGTAANEAIVIYLNNGKIYGHKVSGNGTVSWGTRADTGAGSVDLTSGTGTPAFAVGATRPGENPVPPPADFGDLSNGMDWASQVAGHASFFMGATEGSAVIVDLVIDTFTMGAAVAHIINQIAAAPLTGYTAYDADGTHVGLRSIAIGSTATMNLHELGLTTTSPSGMSTMGIGTFGIEDHYNYFGTGVGWASTPQSFTINVNGTGAKTVTLNTDCETQVQVINEINSSFTTAVPSAVTGVEAYNAGSGRVGIRTLSTGVLQTFTLGAGAPNALPTLGMTAGTYTNGTANPLTSHANSESIIDVQSDRAGGAIIMYRYSSGGNFVFVQRVDSAGTVNLAGWGVNGYTVIGAASTQEVMSCINTPVDAVIVAANMSNVIRAIRVGTSPWAGTQISAAINGEIQQNPQVYINGANTLITWGDNRFAYTSASTGYAHNTGWGIFGMMVNTAAPFTRNASWTANSTGVGTTDDIDGVAVVLNNTMFTSPKLKIAPYNSGSQAILLWEDQRAFAGSDLLFINVNTFSPQP